MASVRKRIWKTAKGRSRRPHGLWTILITRGDRQRKHFANKKAADTFRIQIEGQMQAGILSA